jgi:hypothetical protein
VKAHAETVHAIKVLDYGIWIGELTRTVGASVPEEFPDEPLILDIVNSYPPVAAYLSAYLM